MLIKHFPANTKGRDFVVGDLHGCVPLLHELLEAVTFDAEVDRLFSVGDLIDRGPDSRGALALLDEPWFHAVRGNHEDMLQMAAMFQDKGEQRRLVWDNWIANGGAWAKDCTPDELTAYAEKIDLLPLAIAVGEGATRFNVVHAEFFGSDADLDAAAYDEEVVMRLLWGRSLSTGHGHDKQQGLSTTFCGHTPVTKIAQAGAQLFIDTGAFLPDGALTMVEPKTCSVWIATRERRDGTVNDPSELV